MDQAQGHDIASTQARVEELSKSKIFLDYQYAFTRGVGLPLALQARELLRLVQYPKGQANPFCALIARTNRACAACYALQQKLQQEAGLKTQTLKCFAGLCESAVPVRVGPSLIGFLQTGQVMLHSPTRREFNRVARTLLEWGTEVDLKSAEEAYFQTRVLRPAQYYSLLRLLEVFSEHLAAACEGLMLRAKPAEPAAVTKAREFIAVHHPEPLSLARVSRAVSVSATYFSRRFKETAGMTFIDYLARVRVEKAKSLLQNPGLRISEIALDAGYQSLSQFNRSFKKITGWPPTEFRARL